MGNISWKIIRIKAYQKFKNDEINLHENFQQHLVHCCCKQQKNNYCLHVKMDQIISISPIIDKSTLSMIKISVSEGKSG